MYDEDKNPIIGLTCLVCQKQFDSEHKLSTHIFNTHKIKTKDYIDNFFKDVRKTCKLCEKETTFRDGKYQKFCPKKCSREYSKINKLMIGRGKGKKQSQETVDKRIKNTNQATKEEKRKQTCFEKFGVSNYAELTEHKEKISKIHKGRKNPRTKEWQDKIIQSKIKNNTIKHTEQAKGKMRASQKRVNESENPPIRVSNKSCGRGHKNGSHNGLFYRSSYELTFIKICEENNIKIESAENKKFRCPYLLDSKKKMYYPDFYLPEYKVVVEIKPESMLEIKQNQLKIEAAKLTLENYLLVTEENLFFEPDMLIWEIKNCF